MWEFLSQNLRNKISVTQDFAYERGRNEAAARGLAAVGKLTEIVEVENETWQGAKFGVC